MQHDRRVYIVDDDPAICRALKQLLDAAGFFAVAYSGSGAFLDAAPQLQRGCVLLDVRMAGIDGLEVQARLNRLAIRMPVILMTGQGDVTTAVRGMKAGAIDFIEKPFDDDLLLVAIEGALAELDRRAHNQEVMDAAERVAALTRREREVLDGLVAGRPNKVIAYDLGISVRTVEVHRARMLDRLGACRLADAVRLAVLAALPAATS
jgi:two-component system response regulator FixJ